jgi:hypothetical protein
MFPDYLVGRADYWLRCQLSNVLCNLSMPVFLHPGYSSFSGGERAWRDVKPSVEHCKGVVSDMKNRALVPTFGYEHIFYFA